MDPSYDGKQTTKSSQLVQIPARNELYFVEYNLKISRHCTLRKIIGSRLMKYSDLSSSNVLL